jgi:hypothetical protein
MFYHISWRYITDESSFRCNAGMVVGWLRGPVLRVWGEERRGLNGQSECTQHIDCFILWRLKSWEIVTGHGALIDTDRTGNAAYGYGVARVFVVAITTA